MPKMTVTRNNFVANSHIVLIDRGDGAATDRYGRPGL